MSGERDERKAQSATEWRNNNNSGNPAEWRLAAVANCYETFTLKLALVRLTNHGAGSFELLPRNVFPIRIYTRVSRDLCDEYTLRRRCVYTAIFSYWILGTSRPREQDYSKLSSADIENAILHEDYVG